MKVNAQNILTMTRVIFLLCLLLFNSSIVSAQKIRFTDTSNKWTYIRTIELASQGHKIVQSSVREYFSGDTVIGSVTYKKLYTYHAYSRWTNLTLVREDTTDNKIYSFKLNAQNNPSEIVFLNFNLQLNDTITDGYDRYSVISIDSTLIDSIYHKVFFISEIYGSGVHQVIENIDNYTLLVFGYIIRLNCFSNKGQRPIIDTMYQKNQNNCSDSALSIKTMVDKNNELKLYPQPAQDQLIISFPYLFKNGEIILTNIQGRIVLKNKFRDKDRIELKPEIPQGIYFYRITDNTTGNMYTGKAIFAW